MSLDTDLMEKVWRFRHRHFVERFGWEDIRQPDGREIDLYDTDRAVHLPLILGGEVVGYSRLLPTEEPHLLSDVYPYLMDEGTTWPRGPTIYEWTRCVADTSDAKIAGVPISHVLMTGVMEYCLMAGISALIVETHPKLVQLLVTTGWDVMPLSAPKALASGVILPIEAKPSPIGLLKHHELYGINGSVFDPAVINRNPLFPHHDLKLLPYLGGHHSLETETERAG